MAIQTQSLITTGDLVTAAYLNLYRSNWLDVDPSLQGAGDLMFANSTPDGFSWIDASANPGKFIRVNAAGNALEAAEVANPTGHPTTLEIPRRNGIGGTFEQYDLNAYNANVCGYSAILVTETMTIASLDWRTGTVGATGNFDIGLYSDDGTGRPGTRLASLGSTTFPASGTDISSNIADQALEPGLYWIGFGVDNTTDKFVGAITLNIHAPLLAAAGIWYEAAFPLPATATPINTPGGGITSINLPAIVAMRG